MVEITESLCCTNMFGANSWFACFKILVFCVGGLLFSNIPLLRLHVLACVVDHEQFCEHVDRCAVFNM